MKYTQMTKRVLACGMALAMATTSTGFYPSLTVNAKKKSSKAKAGKAKAGKVKLNKKKATLTEGSTITLKVKSANKKVKWSSKNKKIASVAKVSGKKKDTATIKGMKKGKTTIIAKVGKKKLTCKVTIQKSNLKAVAVDTLDSSALIVTFAKKTALNAADVKIAVKGYKEGTYNVQPKVEAISTKDQKKYYLYLTSGINNGDYVKVTHGKYVREIQHKEKLYTEKEKNTIIVEKDSTVNENLSGYVENAIGNVSFSLKKKNKLPKGMVLAGKKAMLKGIPTEAGSTEFTLVATDEAGRSIDVNYVFKTYDENTLAVEDLFEAKTAKNEYMNEVTAVAQPLVATTAGVIGDISTYVETVKVEPKGGSGRYKFTLTSSDPTVRLSTDKLNTTTNAVEQEPADSTIIYIPYGLAEGDHSYTLNIQDAVDGNRVTTATVNFTVDPYYNVSGTVTDSQGTALQGNELVYFIPKDAHSWEDYIEKQIYAKEQLVKYEKYEKWVPVKRNYREPDNEAENKLTIREAYELADGSEIRFKEYNTVYSAKVGPLPAPTVLVDAPAAAQATTAPTATVATETQVPGTPVPTPYVMQNLDAGKYAAELPKGDYVVKVRGNNGVLYQLDGAVSVAADAVDTTNLQMPVHFANVTGVAKFANGKTLPGGAGIYFETTNKQYEDFEFSVKTDYTGKFNVSLPVGTYNAYWWDKNEKKKYYFAAPITIDDNTNVELGEISLSINRSVVSGVFYAGPAGADGKRPALGGRTLYFYDAKGKCYPVTTDEEKKWINGVWTNCTEGAYSIVLPDGTYTVRYESTIKRVTPIATPGTIPTATPDTVPTATPYSLDRSSKSVGANASGITEDSPTATPINSYSDYERDYDKDSTSGNMVMYTLATINVAGTDVTQELNYTGDMKTEFFDKANTPLALGTDTTMVSTGNNDLVAKFDVPAPVAPDTDKKYEFDVTYTMDDVGYEGTVKVIGSDGSVYNTKGIEKTGLTNDYGYNERKYVTEDTLPQGTYYVVFTPYAKNTNAQAVGVMTAKVSAYAPVSFTTPQNLVSGASIEVTCTKNSTDPRMKGYGYFTMDIATDQRYVDLKLTTATIGANTYSISYSLDGLSWSAYDEGESLPTGKVYFRIYCGDVLSAKYTVTAK